MKRSFLTLFLLPIILPVYAGEFWSTLWRNEDQRGEALMQRGDASSAAKVFTDPHRKAYAKLSAGDYQGAAKDLGELNDSDAQYNRGNALAHTGDLQAALLAYDAALKINPNNQDATHNRDLVANALKQQPAQQQKSGDKKSQDEKKNDQQEGQQDKRQDKDSTDTNKQNQQREKDQTGSQDKTGNNNGKSGKGQDSVNQQDKTKQDKDNSQAHRDDNTPPNQDKNKNGQQAQADKADHKKNLSTDKDDAKQAKRDVEASLNQPAKENMADSADGKDASKTIKTIAVPKSEQQIAKEQWLRSIPEDPGGLLRRKFLIEHMIRQQKAN